eukprot:Sspe_Gene.99630::Locus_73322_Transcript_1_1_Confidence_1.000_Length_2073::g.99630::m.99630/K13116/DDX41, ABS; ATP-dependent RNA helicase DDX41
MSEPVKRKRYYREDLKEDDEIGDIDDKDLYVPLKVRRAIQEQQMQMAMDKRLTATGQKKELEEEVQTEEFRAGPRARKSLLEINQERLKEEKARGIKRDEAKLREEEEREMAERLLNDGRQLKSVYDLAHGITYTERMKSTWHPPGYVRDMTHEEATRIRQKKNIIVEGNDVCNPCLKFQDLRFPPALISALREKHIIEPTPIQQQALPAVLTGRDVIGVAFTGSGKTLVFVLPMIMFALEEERRMPLQPGEGPLCLAISPSRELAKQTAEVFQHYAGAMRKAGHPELRCMLAMGGISMREQEDALRRGMHAIVATPGRLIDILKKRKVNLDICRFVCLDEADRMVDVGFDEEVKEIYQFFKHQRQTVMFSATMPKKIQTFAMTSLVDPVTVNVNRAGAANLDVVQEVEYVKQEGKILYLLECLQKTPPPVLIFAENKSDVDMIHEYLLLKCVQAVSIHGSKDQADRNEAIRRFKERTADVLVATDVASKGLDFPDVQHVINYDLPKEIENYVHRIGRTGRCGNTGLATTFINKSCSETALLDLKYLLIEAKQRVPPVLLGLHDPLEELMAQSGGQKGGPCPVCGGLGHTLQNCPKLIEQTRAKTRGNEFAGGGDGGM